MPINNCLYNLASLGEMMSTKKETPMMAQYRSIRRSLPEEIILFFRLGDFYEMFFDDAVRAASILDITLTKRNEVPMCGVPYHAAASYLEQLIKAEVKVAICEQVEDASQAKGVVRREVTRIVTPGTIIDEMRLDDRTNNYISALFQAIDGALGLAMLDLSTGACWIEEPKDISLVVTIMERYQPSECLLSEEQVSLFESVVQQSITACEHWQFEFGNAEDRILRHFNTPSLEGLGLAQSGVSLSALGALMNYVQLMLHRDLSHLQAIQFRQSEEALFLDETTITNLELVTPLYTHRSAQKNTVLQVIDTTCTPMGARLIREWLLRPLNQLTEINQRQDSIERLIHQQTLLSELRTFLKEIRDMERVMTRIGSASSNNPRELQTLSRALQQIPPLKKLLSNQGTQLEVSADHLEAIPSLTDKINYAIKEKAPLHLRDGGVIKDGFNIELDELREAASSGRSWLATFQAEEAKRTGIKTLKVRFNKVFGYYIEISKSQLDRVPDHYQRKQTLTNAERYVVPELTQYADRILGAEERAIALEQDLFQALKNETLQYLQTVQHNAQQIAYIDVIASLAERALTLDYVRPVMSKETDIQIKEGRHPVVEQLMENERFVPNDSILNQDDHQLILITGPNMAGKSTYIRQVALITILAHMGSFVPAREAKIGLVDRVFTRVGASDDLARGRSTFMVEMQETANILNQATDRSLIILDEIGRGTSTYDGISIAWSVAEFLTKDTSFLPRTLFATHYHELTDLADTLSRIRNYSVAVREQGKKITFLRKIIPQAADKSYGIQVARLAGLPGIVVERAESILASLEQTGQPETTALRAVRKRQPKMAQNQNQLDLL
ncbi:MAG: DNA mismatch repair protein MutS [Kiritimatiellaceae bacterium]|jgi:DNA mismatch repair protein MutS|nr:DNA mismatch repair protein MutS [Kiritimatiellaceae bacterium]